MPSVDGDPHFIIQVPQKDDAICFNIDEDPGTVLRLIQDPITGGSWGWAWGQGWDQVLTLPNCTTFLCSLYPKGAV